MNAIARLILATSISVVSAPSFSLSFFDPLDDQLDMGEYLAENAYGFLPVPIFITEPAVGYGGGLVGVFLHETDEQREKRKQLAEQSIDGGAQLLTPAITAAGGFVTENGTWLGFIGHRRTWSEDSIRYMGGIGYGDINMTFYNQNSTNDLSFLPNGNGVELGMKGTGGIQQLQFRLPETNWFVGLSQLFFVPDMSINNGVFDNSPLEKLLNRTSNSSGLGVIIEYDSKDSFLSPRNGYNYLAEYLWFNKTIGSDFIYQTLNAEGTNYWQLSDDINIALKGQYKALYTDENFISPQYIPDIELRGIPRNLHQGERTFSLESQILKQWNLRWSTNFFAGIGYNGESNQDMFSQDSHVSYGVGFRYLIARRYGLTSGVDLAFSEDDSALYFQVGVGI
ncbi:BamA/TamA family outer membrane protein [Vibrio sp. RE86]|uniref:BamA/TamA family outer membrane protein n=1 Tax=Vibrio sp. RE86 TaxID=2607605 RepID=UPI001493922F|nr:BamA/TamA family outer membrane protein [Vibrio sp. RE86]NOH80202.1 BamA/TamA family outer membrane protein [Vibrio sp. RE86]